MFSKNPCVVEKRDKISDEELLKCYYDHCVREIFRELVLIIIEKDMSKCDLEHYRMFAIDTLNELMSLTDAVELTENALSIIVNKLGDGSKKVQCHAIQVLTKLTIKYKSTVLEDVPAIIVRELGQFLDRSSRKPSHRVYALGCLNKLSTIVVSKNIKIRASFLQIYFKQFHIFVHATKGEAPVVIPPKKDRSIGKNDRIKMAALAKKKAAKLAS